MRVIKEIFLDFIFVFKNNNLITYKGILFLILFKKNKNKLNILLLKLGFYNYNNFNNSQLNLFI